MVVIMLVFVMMMMMVMIVIVVMMMVIMIMVVVMVVIVVVMRLGQPVLLSLPGSPEHPECGPENNYRRDKLQPGLNGLGGKRFADIHPTERNQPYYGGMRQRRCQSQHHRLFDGPLNSNNKGRHHRLGMPWFQTVQHT